MKTNPAAVSPPIAGGPQSLQSASLHLPAFLRSPGVSENPTGEVRNQDPNPMGRAEPLPGGLSPPYPTPPQLLPGITKQPGWQEGGSEGPGAHRAGDQTSSNYRQQRPMSSFGKTNPHFATSAVPQCILGCELPPLPTPPTGSLLHWAQDPTLCFLHPSLQGQP